MSSKGTQPPPCAEVEVRLSAFTDGDLPALEHLGIERHLESCLECRRQLAQLEGALRLLREEGRRVPEPPAWDSVRAKLAASNVQGSGWARWLRDKRTLAASIGLVVAAGVLFALFAGEWSRHNGTVTSGVESARLQLAGLPGLEGFLADHRAQEVRKADLEGSLGFVPKIPDELPGGFHLEKAYLVRDRCCAGSCLLYRKGKELVSVVQHPPSHPVSWSVGEFEDCTIAGRFCRRSRAGEVEVVQIEPDGRNLTVVARAGAIDVLRVVKALASG